MEDLNKRQANQEAAKLITRDMVAGSEEKELSRQVKNDFSDAWIKSQSPASGLTTFDWIWDILIGGFKRRKGIGKFIYLVIWILILWLIFWGLSKLTAST